jgi:hypothetical protein
MFSEGFSEWGKLRVGLGDLINSVVSFTKRFTHTVGDCCSGCHCAPVNQDYVMKKCLQLQLPYVPA